MDNTLLSPERQGLLLLYSLALGLSLAVFFGFVRFPFSVFVQISKLRGKKRVFGFIADLICDIITSVIYTLSVVLFIYAANEGVIRYFMIAASFAGVILYRLTLGRLLNKLAEKTARPVYNGAVRIYKGIIKLLSPVRAAADDKKVKKYIKNKIRADLLWR